MSTRNAIGAVSRGLWRLACLGFPKGESASRYAMYKRLREQLKDQDLGDRVLSISHSQKLCYMLGAKPGTISDANYPDCSIDRLPFDDGSFSAVVSDQVLEHVSCTPTEAVEEVRRVLRPSGIAVHTTCFMTPFHGTTDATNLDDGDFWRFTPTGLARLHKSYSQVIVADGWGNTLMPLVGALGLTFERVPEASWHPLNRLATSNRPSYATLVWVAARK